MTRRTIAIAVLAGTTAVAGAYAINDKVLSLWPVDEPATISDPTKNTN